jgi:signal transduction histidine kinase
MVQFTSSGKERPIQPVAGEEIVQIVREALRNAIQHAGHTEVGVRSEYGDQFLTLAVRDEGPGMSEMLMEKGKPGHFGIRGMRERAVRIGSSLTVSSSASTGTEWTLRVPATVAYEPEDMTSLPAISNRYMQLLGMLVRRNRS